MELKIRLKSPMIGIRNGMIAEANNGLPDKDKETSPSSIKAIANTINCTLSPFSIDGWLRHGITEYLISQNVSPCYNFDIETIAEKSESRIAQAESDMSRGYHRKGSPKRKPQCEENTGKRCIISELFGDFTHPKKFSIVPIKVTPIKDTFRKSLKNVNGMGNYRNLAVSPRSSEENIDKNGAPIPFMTNPADIIANLDAILHLRMYTTDEKYIGLIIHGIEHLNKHYQEFNYQLGGYRTFGCGFIESDVLPTKLEGRQLIEYHEALINKEEGADDKIKEETKKIIDSWTEEKKNILENFEKVYLREQQALFGKDKKWITK